MRCDYCGWINTDDSKRCVKCNQILPEAPVSPQQPNLTQIVTPNPDKTEESTNNPCSFCPSCGYPTATNATVCPACNTQISNNDSIVPDTKATIRVVPSIGQDAVMQTPGNSNFAAQMKQTVRDGAAAIAATVATSSSCTNEELKNVVRDLVAEEQLKKNKSEHNKGCTITSLDGFNGSHNSIGIQNGTTILKRADIDIENYAIDENQHVEFECIDGQWYIQNLSANNNTYICIKRKMQLENGDIIIIGNRRFIFNK